MFPFFKPVNALVCFRALLHAQKDRPVWVLQIVVLQKKPLGVSFSPVTSIGPELISIALRKVPVILTANLHQDFIHSFQKNDLPHTWLPETTGQWGRGPQRPQVARRHSRPRLPGTCSARFYIKSNDSHFHRTNSTFVGQYLGHFISHCC